MCMPDGEVLVLSSHLLYLFIIFPAVISISSSFKCLRIDVSKYRDHSSSVISVGLSFLSSICSALAVSAPNPISLAASGVASGVYSAWQKCIMFRCSISLSIVGPSVITRYSCSFLLLVSVPVLMIFLLDSSFLMVVQTSFVSRPSPFGRFVLLVFRPFPGSLPQTLLLVHHLWLFSLFVVL
jgi:hypothetical protein